MEQDKLIGLETEQRNLIRAKIQENKLKEMILKEYPNMPNVSGIYMFTREDNGFKYAYIGQAKRLLTRLAGHFRGFQHIDLSLKKHGIYSAENSAGWKITYTTYRESELNDKEQFWIKLYANSGYQLYNHTTGSQGVGKAALGDQKERKGYKQGVNNGWQKARKYIADLFKKNLLCVYQGEKQPTKNQEKAMLKFKEFITIEEVDNGDN